MHHKIRVDCDGRTTGEVLDRVIREVGIGENGPRVVLHVENVGRIRGSLSGLLRQVLSFFHQRELKASIVDPSGCTDTFLAALGGSVHVEVCRHERDISRPLDLLVVEDTPDSLQFLTTLLETAGHRVTAVATGGEALRLCASRSFDVVLLDLILPDVDGMAVARALRDRRIPMIAMSAYLDQWSEGDYLRAGFHRRLRKPFKSADLLAALKS